jgi:hypothetical protein
VVADAIGRTLRSGGGAAWDRDTARRQGVNAQCGPALELDSAASRLAPTRATMRRDPCGAAASSIVEWRRRVDRAIVQAIEDGRLYHAHEVPEGARNANRAVAPQPLTAKEQKLFLEMCGAGGRRRVHVELALESTGDGASRSSAIR